MDTLRFDGRVAIVTGAGGGLGRSHALLLASRGAQVVVNDLGGSVSGTGSDVGPAEVVTGEILDRGGVAVADTNSVATPEGGAAIVAQAMESFGRVDIVVNNAGIIRDAPFVETTPDRLDPVLDVHVKGAFNVTRPAWSIMRAQRYGRVVNTTSLSGLVGQVGQTNYGTAKAGLLGLTRILALEGESSGITVNAVAPTAVTRMMLQAMENTTEGASDPESLEMFTSFMRRLDPDLVSPVVAYLAHESCSVTGQIFTAGGGAVSRMFLGRTPGIHVTDLTIEDVASRLDEVLAEPGYTVPMTTGEEMSHMFEGLTPP